MILIVKLLDENKKLEIEYFIGFIAVVKNKGFALTKGTVLNFSH